MPKGIQANIDLDKKLKECSKCGEMLPFSSFHKRKTGSGGLQGVCIACRHRPRKNPANIDYENRLRECTKCQEMKDFSCFHKCAKMPGGIKNVCIECRHRPRSNPANIDYDKKLRECTKCKKMKDFSCFHKSKNKPGGLKSVCKECLHVPRGPRSTIEINHELRMKRCTQCNKMVSFDDFYAYKKGAGGRTSKCKECTREIRGSTARIPRDIDKGPRQCAYCLKVLPFDSFFTHTVASGGISGICKDCIHIIEGPSSLFVPELDHDLKLKKCVDCSRLLPFTYFQVDINCAGGLSYRCRQCLHVVLGRTHERETQLLLSRGEKRCTKCNEILPLKKFPKGTLSKYGKNGRRPQCRKCIALYHTNRKAVDISYCLVSLLRTRLSKALLGNFKSGSAVRDLGCSIVELKAYLEERFYSRSTTGEEMTWEARGRYGWHIDHVKPLISFDLTDRDQLLEACHYTNLQPLWAEDNYAKGFKEDYEYEK